MGYEVLKPVNPLQEGLRLRRKGGSILLWFCYRSLYSVTIEEIQDSKLVYSEGFSSPTLISQLFLPTKLLSQMRYEKKQGLPEGTPR